MNKYIFLGGFAVVLLLALAFFWLSPPNQQFKSIDSFAECAAAGYPVGESYPRQCWTPDGRQFTEEISPTPSSEIVALNGEITCLPKIGGGPQTLECAIGLKTNEGYYALKNLFEIDPEHKFSSTSKRVKITGTLNNESLEGPDGNQYDILGAITLNSIEEI